MIGTLIIRFKKGSDVDTAEIYEGEFLIGIDTEANLDEYVNNCLEDIVGQVSGEGVDNSDEIFDLEYYFEEVEENECGEDVDNEIIYDWR